MICVNQSSLLTNIEYLFVVFIIYLHCHNGIKYNLLNCYFKQQTDLGINRAGNIIVYIPQNLLLQYQ